eukprot:TRINITY_DN6719_c0_g1_i1.p1 TRINITY_DN6719_c0_g1~~TRINITY_DN6719_c0_g1_i1.p1  ORF type:complete len:327 (-),score=45.14 TRINITY_DN6719_c0_g1_i1:30-983(-)
MTDNNIKVIFGTMTLGGQVNEETSKKMLDHFLEHVKEQKPELDTAFVYENGKSEEILGRLISSKSSVYIATKVNPMEKGGLSPESIKRQLEISLNRLKVDCVDLLYLHSPDRKVPIEETLRACNELHQQGKFKELGLSNYSSWEVVDIWHVCKENKWVLPTVYQGMYNAITRNIESELVPALRKFGIRLYIYNPLAGGLLTGKYQSVDKLPKEGRFFHKKFYLDRYWLPSMFAGMDVIKSACEKESVPVTEASLRWLVHHSVLKSAHKDGIIIGQSNMDHLVSNMEGCRKGPLPPSIVSAFKSAWELCKKDSAKYYR